jgi:hypothetical protein
LAGVPLALKVLTAELEVVTANLESVDFDQGAIVYFQVPQNQQNFKNF